MRASETQSRADVSLLARRLGITPEQAVVAYWFVRLGKVSRIPSELTITESGARGHLRRLRRQLKVTRIGLAKTVCRALRGRLEDGALTESGRLRLSLLCGRLGLPLHLAKIVCLIWGDQGAPKDIAKTLPLVAATAQSYRGAVHRRLGTHSDVDLMRVVHYELSREHLWRERPHRPSFGAPDDLGRQPRDER